MIESFILRGAIVLLTFFLLSLSLLDELRTTGVKLVFILGQCWLCFMEIYLLIK